VIYSLLFQIIGPLEGRISSIASKLGFVCQRLTIGKSKFPVVFKNSVDQTTPESIENAFQETGIQPFNPDAIDQSRLLPSSFDVTKSLHISKYVLIIILYLFLPYK
jgi:hypothetical protein